MSAEAVAAALCAFAVACAIGAAFCHYMSKRAKR